MLKKARQIYIIGIDYRIDKVLTNCTYPINNEVSIWI